MKTQIPPHKIKSWVERHFEVKPRRSGQELRINNPFDGDTGYHFNVSIEKSCCHDWRGDQWAGPVNPRTGKRNCSFVKFVQRYKKCSFPEAVRDILGTKEDIQAFLRPEARLEDPKALRTISVELPNGTLRLAPALDQQAKMLKIWMNKRGYTNEELDQNDIYYSGMDVYWPYYEFDELIYWQSRNRLNKIFRFPDTNIKDTKGNIIGKTEGSKGHFLYGFDDLQFASYLIITESIFGKHALGEQVVATGGAILTETQVKKIKLIGPRNGLILAPDNDKAGIKSIITNYDLLTSLGCRLFYSIPPKVPFKKDGQDAVTKDWNEFIEYLKLSKAEVRELHDRSIKKLNFDAINKLLKRVGP